MLLIDIYLKNVINCDTMASGYGIWLPFLCPGNYQLQNHCREVICLEKKTYFMGFKLPLMPISTMESMAL